MKKLINRLFKKTIAPKPWLPPDTRVYCIGDIHGRYDLLSALIEKIKQDAADFSGQFVMVYLGDFIDRGLFSRDVIDFILGDVQADIDYIYLRGNHEQTLLDFLQEDSVGRSWFTYGGQATLSSYGVAVAKIPTKREDFLEIQSQLRNNLPETHYRFLAGTRVSYTLGSYFFVHAGINPHYSLARQNPEDMLWIRDEFTAFKKPFEKIIVHGHTVTDEPELLPNRIGIDTGAYATGVLTCLVLQSGQQRLIQTPC
ncbi:MAG: metallophosphoesterase family protein [Methylovulum sp.]|nr:metallophosphoesterase family protein [Methylovulum sp.]